MKVGDILMSCHGYNMIIHDFYKVIKVTAKTVTVAEMEKEKQGFCQIPQVRCGDRIAAGGKTLRRYIKNAYGKERIFISDWESASLCEDPKLWRQDNYMD